MPKGVDEETGGQPAPDPIADKSISGIVLLCTALMFLSLIWALYDELVGQRPWRAYQQQFVKSYTAYLKKLEPRQEAAEKAVFGSDEFRNMESQLNAAEQAAGPRVRRIENQLHEIRQQLAAIKDAFQDARARLAAETYELDHTTSEGGRASIRVDAHAREVVEKVDEGFAGYD